MTMYSGDRAAQSVFRARRGRLRLFFELTRGHATPPGAVTAPLPGRGLEGCGVPGRELLAPATGAPNVHPWGPSLSKSACCPDPVAW